MAFDTFSHTRIDVELAHCSLLQVSNEMIDLISKLIVVDVEDRIDVHGALNHSYITQSINADELRAQKTCPFKVIDHSLSNA